MAQAGSAAEQVTGSVAGELLLDPGRCIGCKSCAAACYMGHVETPGLQYEPLERSAAMPMVCRQCKEAPCVAACPNDAMYRDEMASRSFRWKA